MSAEKKRVVVVVEDDQPVGEMIASIINDEDGYYAMHITKPTEALEKLKTIKPDLLVLDVGLPEMSGLELLDEVQKVDELKNVPVMFETAVANDHKSDFKARGVDAVVEKPFNIDELMRYVHKLAPRLPIPSGSESGAAGTL
ncbi:MAG TPA: response regulator [Candidatus Limnocylindrales bacterium]|nr:response regulator [Candidatus Limnocylindrales bacterium]